MTERRDDTTNGGAESRPRERGRYYYDDATGYETYDPADDPEEADEPADEPRDSKSTE